MCECHTTVFTVQGFPRHGSLSWLAVIVLLTTANLALFVVSIQLTGQDSILSPVEESAQLQADV